MLYQLSYIGVFSHRYYCHVGTQPSAQRREKKQKPDIDAASEPGDQGEKKALG